MLFRSPKPQTPNPKPQTPNPKPQTPNPLCDLEKQINIMSFSDRRRLVRAMPVDSSCERSNEEAHQSMNISSRSIKPKFFHGERLSAGSLINTTKEMQHRIQQNIFRKSALTGNEVNDYTSLPIKSGLNLYRKLMVHQKPLQLAGDTPPAVVKHGSTSTNASIQELNKTKSPVTDQPHIKLNVSDMLSKAQLPLRRISIKNRKEQLDSQKISPPMRSVLKKSDSPKMIIPNRSSRSIGNFAFNSKHVRFNRLVKVSVYDTSCK